MVQTGRGDTAGLINSVNKHFQREKQAVNYARYDSNWKEYEFYKENDEFDALESEYFDELYNYVKFRDDFFQRACTHGERLKEYCARMKTFSDQQDLIEFSKLWKEVKEFKMVYNEYQRRTIDIISTMRAVERLSKSILMNFSGKRKSNAPSRNEQPYKKQRIRYNLYHYR